MKPNRKKRLFRQWQNPMTVFQDLSTMDNGPTNVGGGMMQGTPTTTPAPANQGQRSANSSLAQASGAGLSGNATNALANALNNLAASNNNVYNFNTNTQTLATPKSTAWTATSIFQTSAVTKTLTIFNQSTDAGIGASTTSNGGSSAITYNYNDIPGGSSTGNLISRIASEYRRGHGMWCYGFNIQYTTAGVVNPTALGNANFTINYYNGDTTIHPIYINVQDAIRNTQYNFGLLTILYGFNVPGYSQVSVVVPAGDGATAAASTVAYINFFWRPQR